jgi:hypothetical protein
VGADCLAGCDPDAAFVACDSLEELHVQSYLLAFARPSLAAALRLQSDVCAGVRDDDPPTCRRARWGRLSAASRRRCWWTVETLPSRSTCGRSAARAVGGNRAGEA